MLTRVVTGQDLAGSWVTVQDGIDRYAVAQQGVVLVKSVLFEISPPRCFGRLTGITPLMAAFAANSLFMTYGFARSYWLTSLI